MELPGLGRVGGTHGDSTFASNASGKKRTENHPPYRSALLMFSVDVGADLKSDHDRHSLGPRQTWVRINTPLGLSLTGLGVESWRGQTLPPPGFYLGHTHIGSM